ncbi:MAG TPA: hypothetical protein VKY74_04725 [Chloroflexia bacterium]|nr:hypothetical protein [Chloroflexia bacterium]
MASIDGTGAQPNYLLIGLVLGTVAGFLIGALLMLQLGQQTASAVHDLWMRVLGDRERVRFELLSQ